MTSEARALPPPEFILNTIPLTFLSFLAFLIALTVVADPILLSSPLPELIVPVAYMIAILFLLIFFYELFVKIFSLNNCIPQSNSILFSFCKSHVT